MVMDKQNTSAVVVALMAISVFAILVVTQLPSGVEGEVTLIEYTDDIDPAQCLTPGSTRSPSQCSGSSCTDCPGPGCEACSDSGCANQDVNQDLDDVTGDISYLPIGAEPKGDAPEEPDLSTIKPGSYQSRTNKRYGCFKKCFCSGSTCHCTPGGCFRVNE